MGLKRFVQGFEFGLQFWDDGCGGDGGDGGVRDEVEVKTWDERTHFLFFFFFFFLERENYSSGERERKRGEIWGGVC